MKALERLGHDLPDPVMLASEMTHLSQQHGLPARLDTAGHGSPALVIYTDRCVAWLRPTGRQQDSYRIVGVAARRLKDHDRLSTGALLLRGPGWQVLSDVSDISKQGVRFATYWPLISREWDLLGTQPQSPTMPPHHSAYLDLLTRVVEASHELETAKQASANPERYRARASTREQRFSARGVYDFTMLRQPQLTQGELIYIDERPRMRGRVLDVRGLIVTIRFETAIDFADLPPQGALRKLPSDRVYRAQMEAVRRIRTGDVANRWLLPGLVDRRLQPFQPDTTVAPAERLDPQQTRAFQRGLTVPDLSLVLGPPGTGKTRTIKEIALACAQRGQRVLVTSHTNRAVDNVLTGMPTQIRSIRVGNDDRVTGDAREYLADVQVQAVQREVAENTSVAASRLASVSANPDLDRWLSYLDDQLSDADAFASELDQRRAARDAAAARATADLQPRLAAAMEAVRWAEEETAVTTRAANRRRATAARLGQIGAFEWMNRPMSWWVRRAERAAAAAVVTGDTARSELAEAQRLVHRRLAQDPEVQRVEAELAQLQRGLDQAFSHAEQAGAALRSLVATLVTPWPVPVNRTLADHQHFAAHLRDVVGTLRRRSALLADWRASVAQSAKELERELVRYANVVATTCVGTATAESLADLEFDLVIVDEAGQISLPNLLVPLIRARRAVLVGDHRQLPPFLDEDVKRWAADLARAGELSPDAIAEIGNLLRMSAFERLYRPHDDGHQDMLTTQRRMPREIADFVSKAFYHSRLTTEHPGTGVDPIFGRPFVMVDTADRPAAERGERRGRRSESWQQYGYVNELEATMIASLMRVYHRWYGDWAIIVPYRAQVELVRERLASALGDGGRTADRVGTVDSFQGGERDLIIYGFTRSNPRGDVGFLRELRRLNVAISRAKQQLVLVGDAETLSRATDRSLRDLIRSLLAYLNPDGVRPSREVEMALTSRTRTRG